ncbi:class II aldolase/adducin family protein [Phenylobacterium sp.]|uniref:class II aldolase/adducin family protein n=1 Tax=Phenylobacterium sp. TaxID=1871053 RepID=UPI002F407957
MSAQDEDKLRLRLVEVMQAMDLRGLNRGASGNASARLGDDMLVTPSGVPPVRLTPEMIVRVAADGSTAEGALRPSSEWRMHRGLLDGRPDAGAVVHCHSRRATILACAGREIPAMHYMVAVGGGSSIPLAPYATFGSMELAQAVVRTLDGRSAALMANHGQIVVARNLDAALAIAEEVEEQAAIYWGTLAIGGPQLLDQAEMDRILGRFRGYGQKS